MTLVEQLRGELAEARAQIARLTDLLVEQTKHLGQLAAAAPKKPTITIAELFEKFEAARRSAYSWTVVRNRLRPLVRRLGRLPAADLTPVVWAEHRTARAAEPLHLRNEDRSERLPSTRTLNHELGMAKQLLGFGVMGRLLERNPLDGVRPEKCRRGRETVLDEAHLGRLLAEMTPFMRAFTLVCIDTGLRFNECRGLQRGWVSSEGAIALPATKTKGRKARTVVLTARARAALEGLPKIDGCEYFFANVRRRGGDEPEADLVSERQIRRWFRAACLASGVDARAADGDLRLRPHDLRHTAATAALRRGANLAAVQRFLGHSNIAITSRYLHSDNTEVAAIATLMEDGAAREVLNARSVLSAGPSDQLQGAGT